MRPVVRYAANMPSHMVTRKLVRNPNYDGRPTGHPKGWVSVPLDPRPPKPMMREALKESVAREGFRNPIICVALGYDTYLQFGASRLRVAQQLGIPVPAIINDYTCLFEDFPSVGPQNWDKFYTDVPRSVVFNDDGFDQHYFLERKRREHYDPAGMAWADLDADFVKEEFSWLSR